MFRAIIVDDEQKICNLIQILGDWNALSINVEAVFSDSENALSFILSHKPDIVITDIKMPVYDGLQLIEHTRAAGIDSAFVIISGYRHFEYAHKAMQFGIVDYLLKPISEEELNQTLKKICQTLKSKQTAASEKATYDHLLAEKCQGRHFALLKDLSENKVEAENLSTFNDTYLTDFMYNRCRILLLNTSIPQLHISNASFQSKIEDIAQLIFAEHASSFTAAGQEGIFVLSTILTPDPAPFLMIFPGFSTISGLFLIFTEALHCHLV